MQKKKKLFNYETEVVNAKELEEDIKQAEQLITKLKDKLDPKAEKLKRIQNRTCEAFYALIMCLLILAGISGTFAGFVAGIDFADATYNYSVSIGLISDAESE